MPQAGIPVLQGREDVKSCSQYGGGSLAYQYFYTSTEIGYGGGPPACLAPFEINECLPYGSERACQTSCETQCGPRVVANITMNQAACGHRTPWFRCHCSPL